LSADDKNNIVITAINDLQKNKYDDISLCNYLNDNLWNRNVDDYVYSNSLANVKVIIHIRCIESNEELLVVTRCNSYFTSIKGGFSKDEYNILQTQDEINQYGKNKKTAVYTAATRELKEEIGFLCEFTDSTKTIKLNLKNKKNPIIINGTYKLYENRNILKKKFVIDATFPVNEFNILKNYFKYNKQSLIDKMKNGAELSKIVIVHDNIKSYYNNYIKL